MDLGPPQLDERAELEIALAHLREVVCSVLDAPVDEINYNKVRTACQSYTDTLRALGYPAPYSVWFNPYGRMELHIGNAEDIGTSIMLAIADGLNDEWPRNPLLPCLEDWQ